MSIRHKQINCIIYQSCKLTSYNNFLHSFLSATLLTHRLFRVTVGSSNEQLLSSHEPPILTLNTSPLRFLVAKKTPFPPLKQPTAIAKLNIRKIIISVFFTDILELTTLTLLDVIVPLSASPTLLPNALRGYHIMINRLPSIPI